MLITAEIFCAFLNCETKSYLHASGEIGPSHDLVEWERSHLDSFKQKCLVNLCSNLGENECLVGMSSLEALENSKYRLIIDCVLEANGLRSHIHLLERSTVPLKRKQNPFIPIRFFPNEKITKHDKLVLAFDALVLSTASGKMPLFGKIIHGSGQKVVKVKLAGLMEMTEAVVSKIAAQQASSTPPQLILNKHCPECEFQSRCRQIALERDDLSLLSGLSEKERNRQKNRGIFTVTQLAYTFRPRRKPKRFSSLPEKYQHALRALAIRENKVHIVGKPELHSNGNPVYLDVEGVPDRDFYYLIGVRFKSGNSHVQHSFWANKMSDEKEIWAAFLQTLARIENPQLIHYGSYETAFLKRMRHRYGDSVESPGLLNHLISEAVNLLSNIYARIYFPTYSNSLKEIAQYIGFQWSDNTASGLNAIIWRSQWESTGDPSLKQKLIVYNAEDCEALERVTNAVIQLCQRQTDTLPANDSNIVHTDSIKRQYPQRFGNNNYSMPELEYINRAAYWDYQREKIYVRTNPRLKRVAKKGIKGRAKALPVDRIVECPAAECCPKCKTTEILRHNQRTRLVYDLKFTRNGIKRWIVRCIFHRYSCNRCGTVFCPEQSPVTGEKYGRNMLAYIVYQLIELHLSQITVTESLNLLFHFRLDRATVHRQKSRAANLYKDTYDGILTKIMQGELIHADETKVSIKGRDAFVWVFTNLEEVVYFYTETREGDTVQALLKEFKGVLVSDFYTAYDSIDCPQQKCLIHLMRDLNEDLFKQPFNEELKELVHTFACLLKPMIETVDRFGLKEHFLRKHKEFVEQFYIWLSKQEYKSDVAVKYKKRFDKNRNKLFTFLNHDGIPWNNNNAEHAIKAFVALRNVIGSSTSDAGIREYLILLSICETCKYKGVSFLDFLRSGERDIDVFIKK